MIPALGSAFLSRCSRTIFTSFLLIFFHRPLLLHRLKYFHVMPPGGRSCGISLYLHPDAMRYRIAFTISLFGYFSGRPPFLLLDCAWGISFLMISHFLSVRSDGYGLRTMYCDVI